MQLPLLSAIQLLSTFIHHGVHFSLLLTFLSIQITIFRNLNHFSNGINFHLLYILVILHSNSISILSIYSKTFLSYFFSLHKFTNWQNVIFHANHVKFQNHLSIFTLKTILSDNCEVIFFKKLATTAMKLCSYQSN